jgi:hypothetical protein
LNPKSYAFSALRIRNAIQSVILSASILVVEVVFVKPWPLLGDAIQYSEMAGNPLPLFGAEGYSRGMYGYRILTPLLVHILPFGVDDGFRIVTCASLLLSSLVLYGFLANCFHLSHRVSMVGQALFLTNITIVYNIANYRLVDALSYLFLILGLYFIYTGRDLPFAATMLTGVLNKEIELMLAPVYYLVKRQRGIDFASVSRTALLCLPALGAYAYVHLLFSGLVIDRAVSLTGVMTNLFSSWVAQPARSLGLFVFSWSLLWVLSALGYLASHRDQPLSRLVYLMPFVLPWTLSADISRMLAYAFPATIAYSALILSAWSRTRRGLWAATIAVIAQTALQVLLIVYVLPR